jgi:hypothetical protein
MLLQKRHALHPFQRPPHVYVGLQDVKQQVQVGKLFGTLLQQLDNGGDVYGHMCSLQCLNDNAPAGLPPKPGQEKGQGHGGQDQQGNDDAAERGQEPPLSML